MEVPNCLGCGKAMSGKFVQAIGGFWHLDCFSCPVCSQIVASKFFPIEGKPYCERDYFQQKQLVCHVCQEPIKGANISIARRKWHPEHFRCTLCDTLLHTQDSSTTYFEHDTLPYCALHYSALYATPCTGCHMSILDQFVEDTDQKWHVDCYKIYKIWNLKLPPKDKYDKESGDLFLLKKMQDETKLRITTTFVILWNLEEEIAHAISEMIISYDTGNFAHCQKRAAVVTRYSEDLFEAINKLFKCGYENKCRVENDEEQNLAKASDFLCSAIEGAFLFIAKTADLNADDVRQEEAALLRTSEFINFSMSIAHAFKELIGLIISIAYRLESSSNASILDLVLFELRFPETQGNISQYEPLQKMKEERRKSAMPLPQEPALLPVSVQEPPREAVSSQPQETPGSAAPSEEVVPEEEPVIRRRPPKTHVPKSRSGQIFEESLDAETECLRSRVRQSLTAHLSQFYEEVELSRGDQIVEAEREDSDGEAESTPFSPDLDDDLDFDSPKANRPLVSGELSQTSLQQDRQRDRETNQPVKFLSDLSSLELLLVKQLAVYRLATILRGHFTLEQLNAFIQVHKPADLISKIFGMVKIKKKVDHACFGQPLYVAVERTGVDSSRGSSLGALKIPRVMEEGIGFLEKNAFNVKGLFRKAGSESRVQTLRGKFSKHTDANFENVKPHDVSALIKRFLREMPEPLLTFPLYDLLVASQKFSDLEIQEEILHLAVILLPKCNRDLLEVVTTFLRKLSDHALGVNDQEGNLMTPQNLATVFAPTVMYSEKEKAAQKEVTGGTQRKSSIPSLVHRSSSNQNIFLKSLGEHEDDNQKAVAVFTLLIENSYAFSKVPSLLLTQLSKPAQFLGITDTR